MRAHEGGYYIRLYVEDRPGAFAHIAERMAEQDISLQSIVQKRESGSDPHESVPVVLITHKVTEAAVRAAVEKIEQDGYVDGPAQVIRIETL